MPSAAPAKIREGPTAPWRNTWHKSPVRPKPRYRDPHYGIQWPATFLPCNLPPRLLDCKRFPSGTAGTWGRRTGWRPHAASQSQLLRHVPRAVRPRGKVSCGNAAHCSMPSGPPPPLRNCLAEPPPSSGRARQPRTPINQPVATALHTAVLLSWLHAHAMFGKARAKFATNSDGRHSSACLAHPALPACGCGLSPQSVNDLHSNRTEIMPCEAQGRKGSFCAFEPMACRDFQAAEEKNAQGFIGAHKGAFWHTPI